MLSAMSDSSREAGWYGVGDVETTAPDNGFDRGFAADLISRGMGGRVVARFKPCPCYEAKSKCRSFDSVTVRARTVTHAQDD